MARLSVGTVGKPQPVFWKPRYATRGQRHRAWVKEQARREAGLHREPRRCVFTRLSAWLSRNNRGRKFRSRTGLRERGGLMSYGLLLLRGVVGATMFSHS